MPGERGSAGEFNPILRTKLHRPQLDADLVYRDRLIELLNRARKVPLTLVSAPAGYGKSVLVAQWAQQLESPIAWVSLDAGDSELRAFLQYLIAAVDTVRPGACDATRELLAAGALAPVPVLAGYLLNDLDAINTVCGIVIDDYHVIDPLSPVHDLMLRMLEHPPARFRFVVLTRQDPPFDLLGLRAAHRLNDVRLRDLRFTENETNEFLRATAGLSVSDEALTQLEREVEGWAVGLRLVSLALRHVRGAEAFLRRLPGGLSEIQEYLLREVLAGQAAEVRNLMLASSVLDRFCVRGPRRGLRTAGRRRPDRAHSRRFPEGATHEQPLRGLSRCPARVVPVSPPFSGVARGRAGAPARPGARRSPAPAGLPVVRRRGPDRRGHPTCPGGRGRGACGGAGRTAPA